MKNVFKILGTTVGVLCLGATIYGIYRCITTIDETKENIVEDEDSWDEEIEDLEADDIEVTKVDNSSNDAHNTKKIEITEN